MGVYIKGVEMPKDCERCPLLDWDLAYIKCKATDRHFKMSEPWRSERVSDCPLIEVPDGHGRLIDADAILFECNVARIQPGDSFVLRRDIDNEQTIIPADHFREATKKEAEHE